MGTKRASKYRLSDTGMSQLQTKPLYPTLDRGSTLPYPAPLTRVRESSPK